MHLTPPFHLSNNPAFVSFHRQTRGLSRHPPTFLLPKLLISLLCPSPTALWRPRELWLHHRSAKIHSPKCYSMKLSHVAQLFFIFSSVCLRGSLKETDEDEDELKCATSPLKSVHNHLDSTIRPSTASPSLPSSLSETLVHAFVTSTGDYDNNHLLIHSHDPCPPEPPLGPRSPFSDATFPSPPNQGQRHPLHLPPALEVITQEQLLKCHIFMILSCFLMSLQCLPLYFMPADLRPRKDPVTVSNGGLRSRSEVEHRWLLCKTQPVWKSSQRILDWLFLSHMPTWKTTQKPSYRVRQTQTSAQIIHPKEYKEDTVVNYIVLTEMSSRGSSCVGLNYYLQKFYAMVLWNPPPPSIIKVTPW